MGIRFSIKSVDERDLWRPAVISMLYILQLASCYIKIPHFDNL